MLFPRHLGIFINKTNPPPNHPVPCDYSSIRQAGSLILLSGIVLNLHFELEQGYYWLESPNEAFGSKNNSRRHRGGSELKNEQSSN
jgi:hypothetical protein